MAGKTKYKSYGLVRVEFAATAYVELPLLDEYDGNGEEGLSERDAKRAFEAATDQVAKRLAVCMGNDESQDWAIIEAEADEPYDYEDGSVNLEDCRPFKPGDGSRPTGLMLSRMNLSQESKP